MAIDVTVAQAVSLGDTSSKGGSTIKLLGKERRCKIVTGEIDMLPTAWRWLQEYSREKEQLVIGLTSGTSADGVDAALVRIYGREPKQVETINFTTLPYPADIRDAVLKVSHDGDVETLCQLNFRLGELFAEAAFAVVNAAGLKMSQVKLIGSHGQTVRHLPPKGQMPNVQCQMSAIGATLQVSEPSVIALRTRVPVVSNFRAKDIAAGGQGAPLVPLVDWLLLRHRRKTRIALNIGGIANLTVLPPDPAPDEVLAFDTGPGNMLVDGAVRHFTHGKRNFDRDGEWAKQGKVSKAFLDWLMRHPFLQKPPPKSTGREMFGDAFLQKVLSRAEHLALSPTDIVATLTAFTSASIADAVRRFVLLRVGRLDEVIVSGGGANNPVLMEMLAEQLAPTVLRRSDELRILADAKEAIAFAVLAHRTVMGLTGNLPSATGAIISVVLGSVTLPM